MATGARKNSLLIRKEIFCKADTGESLSLSQQHAFSVHCPQVATWFFCTRLFSTFVLVTSVIIFVVGKCSNLVWFVFSCSPYGDNHFVNSGSGVHWSSYWCGCCSFLEQRQHAEEALRSLGEQIHAISRVAIENRLALDTLLAEENGVCETIGKGCCTAIPMHTDPNGNFTKAMIKL